MDNFHIYLNAWKKIIDKIAKKTIAHTEIWTPSPLLKGKKSCMPDPPKIHRDLASLDIMYIISILIFYGGHIAQLKKTCRPLWEAVLHVTAWHVRETCASAVDLIGRIERNHKFYVYPYWCLIWNDVLERVKHPILSTRRDLERIGLGLGLDTLHCSSVWATPPCNEGYRANFRD